MNHNYLFKYNKEFLLFNLNYKNKLPIKRILQFLSLYFTYPHEENIQTYGYATFILRLSFNEKGFPSSKEFNVLTTRTQTTIAKISWIKPLSPHWKWRWRNSKKNYANYVTGIVRRMRGNFYVSHKTTLIRLSTKFLWILLQDVCHLKS